MDHLYYRFSMLSLFDIVHDCLEYSYRAEVSFDLHSFREIANKSPKIRGLVCSRRSWMLESNLVLHHQYYRQRRCRRTCSYYGKLQSPNLKRERSYAHILMI